MVTLLPGEHIEQAIPTEGHQAPQGLLFPNFESGRTVCRPSLMLEPWALSEDQVCPKHGLSAFTFPQPTLAPLAISHFYLDHCEWCLSIFVFPFC